MTAEPKNSVDMGWGADPMKVQHPILSDEVCAGFDADNETITRLKLRGMITWTDANKARARYAKAVEKAIVDALSKQKSGGAA